MRKFIVQQLVTVDGFVAGPDGNLDFFDTVSDFSEVDRDNLAILNDVDEIVLGRRTYEMFAAYWPTADAEVVSHAVNTLPKTVFSGTLEQVFWGSWGTARLNRGDPAAEVGKLKSRPGGNIILWGSIGLARTLMRHRLVDEYQLRVCPVAIGTGTGLFEPGFDRSDLELTDTKRFECGIVSLTYVPRRTSQ